MIRRITNNDPDERMPYKHDPLTKEEISILKKWIKQGSGMGRTLGICSCTKTRTAGYKE